jgi:hypothetical protein
MLCTPIDGIGLCGRQAPHGLRGRTQKAIINYKKRHGLPVAGQDR